MTALSTGTDDIVSQGVVSIGTVTSIAIGVGIYTNQSATYSALQAQAYCTLTSDWLINLFRSSNY